MNHRISFRTYANSQCDEMAMFLQEMAAKGWMFEKFSFGMAFRKSEPRQDVFFDVEVFPKGSENDFGPTDDIGEYAEMCEAAGWRFIDSQGRRCVFKKLREDAEPIVTDEERYQNILRADRKVLWGAFLSSMFLMLMWAASWIGFQFPFFATSAVLQICLLFFVLVTVVRGVKLAAFAVQMRRARRALESGETPFYGKRNARGMGAVLAGGDLWYLLISAAALLSILIYGGGSGQFVILSLLLLPAVWVCGRVLPAVLHFSRNETAGTGFALGVALMILLPVLALLSQPKAKTPDPGGWPLDPDGFFLARQGTDEMEEEHSRSVLASYDLYRMARREADHAPEEVFSLEVYRSGSDRMLDRLWTAQTAGMMGAADGSAAFGMTVVTNIFGTQPAVEWHRSNSELSEIRYVARYQNGVLILRVPEASRPTVRQLMEMADVLKLECMADDSQTEHLQKSMEAGD